MNDAEPTPEAAPVTALAERGTGAINAASATATMEALNVIRKFVAEQLVDGTDYGLIPGTGQKKVMLLPGAQKVTMLFNCWPRYHVATAELPNGHCEFQVVTELVHRSTDGIVGSGVGSASTMESKFRYRSSGRVCPKCGKDTIIKGKEEYGGGWLCFAKKGGCGAKWGDAAPEITSQQAGRVEHPDIYDQRNTVLKMAKKRSLVDAAIGLGCLTELFTQDMEEHQGPPPEEPYSVPPPPALILGDQIAELNDLFERLRLLGKVISTPKFCQWLGVERLDQLTQENYLLGKADLLKRIKEWEAKAGRGN